MSRRLSDASTAISSSVKEDRPIFRQNYPSTPFLEPTSQFVDAKFVENTDISQYQLELQEYYIIQDLLFVLMGVDGKFIQLVEIKPVEINLLPRAECQIEDSLDASLCSLVKEITPLVTYHSTINSFLESYSQFDRGRINHALCAVIRNLLKEYSLLIVQLEHQFRASSSFTLQKLRSHVFPSIQTMTILHSLVVKIHSEVKRKSQGTLAYPKGHTVLDVIAKRMLSTSGDPGAKQLIAHLLAKASVPYFEMLLSWINSGNLRDPYGEFMVKIRDAKQLDSKYDVNDTLWEKQYVFRDGRIPSFLEPYKEKILLAGKYLNIIKRCNISVDKAHRHEILKNQQFELIEGLGDILRAMGGGKYIRDIEEAYQYSNRLLLDYLTENKSLLSRLRSIKRYFFLDQADFLTHFLDLAADELKKTHREVSYSKLQVLLDLVLRTPSSTASSDPYKEKLKVMKLGHISTPNLADFKNSVGDVEGELQRQVAGMTEDASKTGYDVLTFGYDVDFPFSLVITPRTIAKYQQVFRHLLKLKRVEQLLSRTWGLSRQMWKTIPSNEYPLLMRIYAQCGKMLCFVQQVIYFLAIEVLEPNWQALEKQLAKVTTIDEVLQCHNDYVESCVRECMVDSSNPSHSELLYKILDICTRFTISADRIIRRFKNPSRRSEPLEKAQIPKDVQSLNNSEKLFHIHLGKFLDGLDVHGSGTAKLQALAVRLDYNMYYSKSANA
ncbi:gamma tubulin complex Spc97/GCP2 subunit Alp4 [Basidiobolus ranarum]|uniref:Spindle pole body component n=1 Tax=Basidiobolus ranarum TaxID=34480 RepID=A0ABR2VT57_9FUNG